MFFDVDINLAAVIALSLLAIVIGGFWYSPLLFGKKWMKVAEVSQEEIDDDSSNTALMISTVLTLVMVYVLAFFVEKSGANTIWEGAEVGLLAWFGFVFTAVVTNGAYERKNRELLAINLGHHLLVLTLTGALLTIFV